MNRIASEVGNVLTAPLKERNQFVDAAFYDVGALDQSERDLLSPFRDREGSVLVMPPHGSAEEMNHYPNALQFLATEGDRVEAVVVAGVGSSVLGAAALARNVADHYEMRVAAIVSGYGASDVISEALGGWFFYGAVDRAWRQVESLVTNAAAAWQERAVPQKEAYSAEAKAARPLDASQLFTPPATDIGTLYDILTTHRKLRLLLGHSKGNLLISFALRHMAHELGPVGHTAFDRLTVVTLGAVVALHDRFVRQHQFLGGLDMLGRINSQLDIPHVTIPGVGHHLNPAIPMNMSVNRVLEGVGLA
ncbi:MAG: hypothetical protein KDA44_01110 [Planctomycetales bacterium]|nr:hypothetical protein [Planctomycetales bacterium]